MRHLSKVIPVIDLLDKKVVHAIKGNRKKYQPIFSPLINSSCPLAVSEALLKKTQSGILYIADLNAIQGKLLQKKIIFQIARNFPNTEIWLDGGFKSSDSFDKVQLNYQFKNSKRPKIIPVFSSESLLSIDIARRSLRLFPDSILSLDKKNKTFLGTSKISYYPELWPKKIILMNLDKVGASQGPDLAWIKKTKKINSSVKIFGAGGIRDKDDILEASRAGATGWLCSTAIHLNLIGYD